MRIVKEQMQTFGKIESNALFLEAKAHCASSSFHDDVTLVIFNSQPIKIPVSQKMDLGLPSVHEVALDAEHLKQPDILQRVLQLAGQCEGIQAVRSIIYTVLSELFNNALEHGILKLDSKLKADSSGFHQYYENREASLKALSHGRINIRVESLPLKGKVLISVEDSGEGFEWNRASSLSRGHSVQDESYGRGLPLLNALCERVWFEKGGSKVICLLDTKI